MWPLKVNKNVITCIAVGIFCFSLGFGIFYFSAGYDIGGRLQELTSDLKDARDKNSELDAKLRDTQKSLDDSIARLDSATSRADAATDRARELESRLADITAELASIDGDTQAAVGLSGSLRAKLESLKN